MRTYYPRMCSREDLTTRDPFDLVVPSSPRGAGGDKAAAATAAEVILTHGAAVFPGALERTLADAFRNYALARNAAMGDNEQVYVMNSRTGKRRTRWSFFAFDRGAGHMGGGRDDDGPSSAVPSALAAVANHRPLAGTLEALLGLDPAVVKMQTITARRGAEDQGWHPDVNSQVGAASHARTFVVHLSLFVPLQETSSRMGATAVCPRSQYCTEIDRGMEDRCVQVRRAEACGARRIRLPRSLSLTLRLPMPPGRVRTPGGGGERHPQHRRDPPVAPDKSSPPRHRGEAGRRRAPRGCRGAGPGPRDAADVLRVHPA